MGVVAEEKKRMKVQKDLRRLRDDKLKKIEELQKEVEAYDKEISAKRDGYRKAFLPELAETVIAACGMTDQDADCFTRNEFKGLREEIVKKITDWKKTADEVAAKNGDIDIAAESDDTIKKMQEELAALQAEKEKLETELASIKDDDTSKKLTDELEALRAEKENLEEEISAIKNDDTQKTLIDELAALKAENEKLLQEKEEALKVNHRFNDVDLTQFDCFVPTVFTIASKVGLRDELENCKSVEEYRAVVGKILRWFTTAVGKVNNVQKDAEEN